MKVEVLQKQGRVSVTVLVPIGDMTADTAAPFESAAQSALDAGARHLVLDLGNVPFVGSFGIRSINNVLVALHQVSDGYSEGDLRRVLREGGKSGRLKLANANAQSMKVIETSGFDMYLEVYGTVEDAVASFQPAGVANG